MKYAVLFEKTETGYSAHVPDLPGCVAAGATFEETSSLMLKAIQMHLAGMQEDGEDPGPSHHCRVHHRGLAAASRFSNSRTNSCSALRSACCHFTTTKYRPCWKNTVSADGRQRCARSSPTSNRLNS